MRLGQLLDSAGVQPLAQVGSAEVREVVADSRRAGPGACFVAIRGPSADGHDYIAAAVDAGAAAVVCEDPSAVPDGVAFARVANAAAAAGPIAQAARGWPARKLILLGVTGTKGKTTFAYLTRHILRAAGYATAVVGTIGYEFGRRSLPAGNTTPGAIDLAELTAEMVAAGTTHLVMEVSSHALDQHRIDGLDFAAAAFTNLSGDHMDYHHTAEAYLAAKRRLFEGLSADATAVVSLEDEAGGEMARATAAQVLWYGFSPMADLRARIDRIDAAGTGFDLIWQDRAARVDSALIGRHNVLNSLAAAGVCLRQGISLEAVAAALSRPITVPGRFQRVPTAGPFDVLVDYAHTDDALDNALGALQPLTKGRLIVLFGCGGDRDRTKRPRMAAVAEARADRIFVTSDNPRTEDPGRIIDDILAGFSPAAGGKVTVEPDRRVAIGLALAAAEAGDLVVLAGKGHETYQVIGTAHRHFDDLETAAGMLTERYGPAAAETEEGP